jgi:glycosyltransferase involved in cell wall biosynthesis
MKNMHVCMIISVPFPPEEGVGNYVYGLSKKLIEKGNKVTVITRGNWNKTQREVFEGIEVIKVFFIPVYPSYIHLHGIFLNKVFRSIESGIDIVHVHTPLPPFIETSLPIITTIHTPVLTDTRSIEVNDFRSMMERLMGKFVSYPIELRLLKRADIITTVANSVAQELKEYNIDPEDVNVIGNGVDEQIFAPAKNKADDRYILFTGRLAYRKGLFDLIECGKYICKKYDDVNFIIVGDGMLRNKLQMEVRNSGLENRIIFKGRVPKTELINFYQNATIHVIPSHYEGLPTVLLEAMSCGLPVIATAVSGNLDVIEDGKNGLLIPPKSPEEMAIAISTLLEDSSMRCDLGRAARKTIEEKFTWDIISNRMIQCYDSLNKIK